MTPEICTAILKNIWDMADSLTRSRTSSGNWIQHEQKGILHAGLSFPEFTLSQEWFDSALARSEALIYDNHFDDGSYIEGTGGYSQSAYGDFVELKEILVNNGLNVSGAYDEMLQKAGYYNMLFNGPDGTALQYGDQQGGNSYGDRRPELANWFGDDELAFLSSFYQRGKEPEWTSKLFPDSRLSLLRSDWSKNALFAFTDVRGGGQHAHADDNAMIVMAYQRVLLNDAGISSYDESDPQRIWFKSTRAHNTVEINNRSQNIGGAGKTFNSQGTIYDWVSNRQYDFVSQSTKSYTAFDHRRTITFLKPDLWIVSDLISPEDETQENDYKQIWHMLPNANLQTDADEKTIFSDYKSGANIILASADQDVEVVEEMGWYDYSYHQVSEAKYAYFARENVKGKTSYDTVLLPYRNVGGASIDVTRLDLGVPTTEATAIRLNTVVDGSANTMYYLLDYEPDSSRTRTFGNYRTNGKLALVREDDQGNIQEVILNQADGLETAAGVSVVELEDTIDDFSYEISGDKLVVATSDEGADPSQIRLKIDEKIRNVEWNGQIIAFMQEDGYVTLTDQPTEEKPVLDNNAGSGIISRPSQNGAGGNGGGSPIVAPQPTAEPSAEDTPESSQLQFADIAGHWAEADILRMAESGVVNGYPDGTYRPEAFMTRAEFVTVIMRAAGISGAAYAQAFDDVSSDDWFAPWVQAALYAGFIAKDNTFRPNDPITREEMSKLVTILHQRLYPLEQNLDVVVQYADYGEISDWAATYITYATGAGLLQGDDTGNFRPKENATRAEVAAVLNRILNQQTD